MNLHLAVTTLDQQLRAAGIPIHGVRPPSRGAEPLPRDRWIDFTPDATEQQREQALRMHEQHDWTSRQLKTLHEVQPLIENLPTEARTKVMDSLLADFLLRHPDVADRMGVNIAVSAESG